MSKLITHQIISLIAAIEDAHLLDWRRQNEQTVMQVPDFNNLLPVIERWRLQREASQMLHAWASSKESPIMDESKAQSQKERDENE